MSYKITSNYHTHLELCKHATGNVDDYCKSAIARGLTVLGISDHTPLPDNRWITERMEMNQFDSYCLSIDRARVIYPDLKILKAVECESVAIYNSFYENELLGKYKLDYLVGAIHYFPHNGGWINIFEDDLNAASLGSFAKCMIDAMESKLYAFMAHPDIFGYIYSDWDSDAEHCTRDILEAAEQLGTPLEINGKGFRKPKIACSKGMRYRYPWENFWEIVSEYDINVIINSDAHAPEEVDGNFSDALFFVDKYNLNLAELIIKK